MKDYKKMACAACGMPFDDKSDIVVCPECGAPHHRECWKEIGHCACEEKHSDGYEWQPEKIYIGDIDSEQEKKSSFHQEQTEKTVCPNCGKETNKSEKYCEYCGYYLYEAEDPFSFGEMNRDMEELFPFDQAENIQGVPAGDVKRFVGNMWIYYIPRFIRMVHSKSPVSFNFTAFLTHGLWFISRKMYLPGILMMIAVTRFHAFTASFGNRVYTDDIFRFVRQPHLHGLLHQKNQENQCAGYRQKRRRGSVQPCAGIPRRSFNAAGIFHRTVLFGDRLYSGKRTVLLVNLNLLC